MSAIASIPSYDFNQNQFVILTKNQGNRGDIACGYKFAKDLHERLQVLKENICIITTYPNDFLCFNTHSFTVLDHTQQLPFPTSKKIVRIGIPDEIGASHELKWSTPLLNFGEYNFGPYPCTALPETVYQSYSLGISSVENQNAIGIMIDHELMEIAFSNKKIISKLLSTTLDYLSGKGLKTALLGSNGTASHFKMTDDLYMGYSARLSWLTAYVRAIIRLQNDSNKDITIIFPMPYQRYEERVCIDEFSWENFLKDCNIRRFYVFNVKRSVKDECDWRDTIAISENAKKNVRLYLGDISHEDMRCLWLASEKETVVTGDHTLSEAISTNKCFVYQTELHKKNLGNALNQLQQETFSKEELGDFEIASHSMENLSDRLYRYFHYQRMEKFRFATKLNTVICAKYDYWPKMVGILERALSGRTNYEGIPYISNPTPDTVPFDTLVIISLDSMVKLHVNIESGQTNLSGWEDSSFKNSYFLSQDSYLICRRKIVSAEKPVVEENKEKKGTE